MSHASNKRQRIEQIEHILWNTPGGLTRSELARRINVHPGTITKYLDQDDLPHVYEDDGKLKVDRYGNLARMVFDMEEITMLHIAARLLVRQTNQHNPYGASALRKLSRVVNNADEDISHQLSVAAATVDGEHQVRNQEYLNTLQQLTSARSRKRKVTLEYQLDDGKWIPFTFTPYYIEPYAPGLTTHVIGFREPPNEIRTFKLERLRHVKVSTEDAVPVPEGFDPDALLEFAWGIWYTNEPPQKVVLKFMPRVQRRVLETRWHRKQEKPEVLDDGSVIWRCLIAEPREMLYWIRGWGADVEVLEPQSLRESIRRHLIPQMNTYNIVHVERLPHQLPYAKTNPDNSDEIHLLLYHLIDVGQVALAMWQLVFTDSIRQRLAHILNLNVDQTGQFIAFIAALHDLGKAFPGYQKKYGPLWLQKKLREAGLGLEGVTGTSYDEKFPHGTVSTWVLTTLLPETIELAPSFAHQIAVAIGGHHGSWPAPNATDRLDDSKFPCWDEVRRDLFWELGDHLKPGAMPPTDGVSRPWA